MLGLNKLNWFKDDFRSGTIQASVGPRDFHDAQMWRKTVAGLRRIGSEDVNYFGEPGHLAALGQKNRGLETYVISNVNAKNKVSESFGTCVGLVVVGKLKGKKQNISLMSHQSRMALLTDTYRNTEIQNAFRADLRERLQELLAQIEPESLDMMIFAGRSEPDIRSADYRTNFDELEKIVFEITGKRPHRLESPSDSMVLTTPWNNEGIAGVTDVAFDNKRRRLLVGTYTTYVPGATRD